MIDEPIIVKVSGKGLKALKRADAEFNFNLGDYDIRIGTDDEQEYELIVKRPLFGKRKYLVDKPDGQHNLHELIDENTPWEVIFQY